MPRKTIIFGNGLGMALSPDHFSLDNAIGHVWNDPNILSEEGKLLICNCLPEDRNGRPHGEEELDKLQLALSACDLLNGIPGTRIHWLTEQGQEFPNVVKKFIYNTALHFHNFEETLPDDFILPLAKFLKETESHIGTLNYDNLLYQPMIEQEVLSGYNGALVDGFFDSGFNSDNLNRKYSRTFGYYLHLHGSPLFIDRNQSIIKLHQTELYGDTDTISSHIVLTHFEHKPTIISASEVLSQYWDKLTEAINESEELLLVGYSGADIHLNNLIKRSFIKNIRIVEWEGDGTFGERLLYWRQLLLNAPTIIQKENILEFTEWD